MKKAFKIFSLSLMLICGATASAQQRGYDKANMNLDVKPGDNFVEYACGNWLKTHPLRDDQMTNGATFDLYELNQKQIQEMILEFSTQPQEKGSLGYKIGTLYNQMMDTLKRNEQGLKPIMPYIERIRAVKDRKEYQRVTAEIDRRGEATMTSAMPTTTSSASRRQDSAWATATTTSMTTRRHKRCAKPTKPTESGCSWPWAMMMLSPTN